MRLLQWLVRRVRLLTGRCPRCNSDAPEVYECSVCRYHPTYEYPSKELKQLWLDRLEEEDELESQG